LIAGKPLPTPEVKETILERTLAKLEPEEASKSSLGNATPASSSSHVGTESSATPSKGEQHPAAAAASIPAQQIKRREDKRDLRSIALFAAAQQKLQKTQETTTQPATTEPSPASLAPQHGPKIAILGESDEPKAEKPLLSTPSANALAVPSPSSDFIFGGAGLSLSAQSHENLNSKLLSMFGGDGGGSPKKPFVMKGKEGDNEGGNESSDDESGDKSGTDDESSSSEDEKDDKPSTDKAASETSSDDGDDDDDHCGRE